MLDDGLNAGALLLLGETVRWPGVSGLVRPGEDGWRAGLFHHNPPLARCERRALVRRLWRHCLCLTPTGRRRLRIWLDGQRGRGTPMVVETHADRYRRLASTVRFYGDADLLHVVVDVLATLPRAVAEYVVASCLFVVSGRGSHGWTTGRFPSRRPIVLAGHRTDAEIADTCRHECAHVWLHAPVTEIDAATAIEDDEHRARLQQQMESAVCPAYTTAQACAFVGALEALAEQQADVLGLSWS